jgi:Ca2+-binding EF-hand superfamily protein
MTRSGVHSRGNRKMKKFVPGGIVLAALCISVPSIAQNAPPASPGSPVAHAHQSFFTSNESRADAFAHVQKMFGELDLNRDGFLTKDELAASQARFDEKMAKSAPKRAARLFKRLDSNHDGQITLAEIEAAHSARLAARGEPVKPGKRRASSSLLRLADANKDGVLTRAEFDSAVASGKLAPHHSRMRGSQLARMFDSADVNRDGRLSLEEARQATLQRFDAADVNRDGVLTPDERRQASKAERQKRRAI